MYFLLFIALMAAILAHIFGCKPRTRFQQIPFAQLAQRLKNQSISLEMADRSLAPAIALSGLYPKDKQRSFIKRNRVVRFLYIMGLTFLVLGLAGAGLALPESQINSGHGLFRTMLFTSPFFLLTAVFYQRFTINKLVLTIINEGPANEEFYEAVAKLNGWRYVPGL